jgi:hypothetical protein
MSQQLAKSSGRMRCSLKSRQSSEASGHLIKAAHPAGHLAQAKIATGRQARSVHNTSTRRYRGSYLVLVIIMPVGIRSAHRFSRVAVGRVSPAHHQSAITRSMTWKDIYDQRRPV